MPRQSVEIRRRRALILNDGDDDDGGGGRAGEAGAGGAPSSSSQPVAAARGREIIDIDNDEEEEEEGAEVVADAEVQLGEGGGLVVKEEPPSDSDSGDVDWDELERLYPSDEERSGKASYAGGRRSACGGPTGSPCGEVKCASSTSGGASTGRQEGASEVAGEAEEMDLEDDDGAEEGQQDHQEEEDKDEEYEAEEEEDDDDDDEETEEDEAGDEESEAGEGPGRRGVPSSARAAAGDSATEVFLRRKFEGWLISRVADTANDAGSTVAARTRSRRRCPNRKLLRRGTCSKPYCVDTASSESAWESSESEKAPPRAPAPSSSEEREPGAGGRGSYRRTVTGKRRRRGMKPAHGDDSSDSGGGQGVAAKRRGKYMKNNAELGGGGGEDRGTAARRRGKRAMEPDAAADGHGDDDESDGPFASSRKPKGAYAFKNKDGFGDVTFKNSSLVIPRGQGRRERETYDDLLDTIFEGIENYHNGSAPPDASVPPAQGLGCDTLPLIFSFGDEEEVVVEKTEHEEVVEELFADWDNLVLEEQQQYNDDPAHTHDKDEKSNMDGILADGATSCRCKPGKHVLFLDDQIGIRCKICDYIEMEIRDVFPAMMKDFADREPAADRELDLLFDDILKSIGHEGASEVGGHKTGVVWDLIPGVREDMFPHQQEGFEFMWKRLAGGIDIEQLKQTMNSDTTSGCVISHAPGTGKTRLAITFVQSYLEIFPHCRPVIIAPRGMLATWEQEFRKWKVKLPFHVLSSSDIQWSEDKTIQKLVSRDESLRQKLSANKLSQKSTLMLKLASWYEGSSIIGLSYSLYRNLAKGEGADGKTVRNLLLEKPGLLVLDEGHTPRNKKSLIWKVLAEVSTEKRIILSGTPFQNNFLELYNILCLVKPKFARDFACTRLSKKGQSRAAPHVEEDEGKEFWTSLRIGNITDEHIREIREKLDPFVHIHNGDILQKSLPGLRESVVILNPLPRQKEIIAMMEKSAGKGFLDAEYKISLASIHPFLVTGTKLSDEEASIVEKMQSVRLNPSEGVKTWFVLEIVCLCEALKERVLVFSQYLEPLALIMDQLTRKFKWTEGREILLMSGNVRVKQREALMEAFNDMNSEAKVMLASTKACCEGITLVGASRVVLLDVVWNPSVGRQAIGRAYRIGQEKIVYTYNLIAEGTKEKVKYDRQASKDHMSKLLFSNELQPTGSNQAQEMFSDRVLETMTGREDLKDMFVQISH